MGRLDPAVAGVLYQHAGMADIVGIGPRVFLDLVAEAGERLDEGRLEAVFQLQAR